jgi:hypothetical protein
VSSGAGEQVKLQGKNLTANVIIGYLAQLRSPGPEQAQRVEGLFT